MARGIRKSGRKGSVRRGALAGFHSVNLESRSRSLVAMGTLTNVEITTARRNIPSSAAALSAAQVFLEVAYRFSVAGDPRPDFMQTIESSLDLLDAGAEPLDLLALSLGVLIRSVGYGWRTDECAGCRGGEQLTFFFYSTWAGGMSAMWSTLHRTTGSYHPKYSKNYAKAGVAPTFWGIMRG